ncbi:hypothetical protein BGY98DRAFT_1029144 [Russula aff. rugulosa BPL654]|nr:hypothetical protein BGY98DRAFT_1029144 [Russula aff. rugulosa BPL654]
MVASSQYTGVSYNSQIEHGQSGQQQLHASTPYAFSGDYNAKTPTRYRLLSVLLPCTRRQSRSPNNRLRRKSTSRTRSDSSSRMDPDHVFMSINPPNGLELSNVAHRATVDELRKHIFPMWPTGVVRQNHNGQDWDVRFAGRPWDPKGQQSVLFITEIICRVFWVLAAQGYVYLTSINTGRVFKGPQLVFVRAPADTRTHFFAMSFNRKGNLVTFVDPPSALVNSLGLFIRAVFPRRVMKEHVSDDTYSPSHLTLESTVPMGAEKNHFLAHILRYINLMAFKLDASVPLARCGLFGTGGRKEIWVFKGSESLWSDRK